MPAESPQRPGQATLAGWLIIGGSIVLVVTAWQRVATLHTIEVQEEFQKILAEPPFDAAGITLTTLSTVVRVLAMVAAGAATAATILGFQAMRRSTSARIALTCLAPLVLVGGFATAGLFAPMVVAGITLLWLQPTRDWFAGRAVTPRGSQPGSGAGGASGADRSATPSRPDPFAVPAPPRDPVASPPEQVAPGTIGATETPGAVPPGTLAGPPAAAQAAPSPYHSAGGQAPTRRPAGLVGACSIVWFCTFMVSAGLLLVTLALLVAGDDLFAEFERQQGSLDSLGVTEGQVRAAIFAMTAIAVPWSLAAAGLAVGAFLGRRRARIALAVSSTVAGLLVLVMAVASPLLVVLVAACAITTWLLLRPDVAAWRR